MSKFKLTKDNYYSLQAQNAYWSASLVKEFLSCPARAMATLKGEYERPSTEALLIGSYIDSYFEGNRSFSEFCSTHPEIFNSRTGELKASFQKAYDMIERAKRDKVFMEYLKGRKQVIKTGEVCGVPFRCKMDVYKKGVRIVDLKTVKDFKPMYKPEEGRLNFAEFWNWPLQMAIYQAIEGNKLPTYLAVITKENPPDIDVIQVTQDKLDAELAFLAEKMPYFNAIKMGIIDPPRCEQCEYCRATKIIYKPHSLDYYNDYGGQDDE